MHLRLGGGQALLIKFCAVHSAVCIQINGHVNWTHCHVHMDVRPQRCGVGTLPCSFAYMAMCLEYTEQCMPMSM